MKTREIFRNNIKQLRNDKDLNQTDIAHAIGVDPVTYRNYEYGKRFPSPEIIDEIASFHNINPIELFSPNVFEITPERALEVLNSNAGMLTQKNPLIEKLNQVTDPEALQFIESAIENALDIQDINQKRNEEIS